MYPGKDADKGRQEFTYSFYVHDGDYVNSVVSEGYALNDPPKAFDGSAPEAFTDASVANCSAENVAIDWVKNSEDGEGIIVRAYEFEGLSATAEISLNKAFGERKAYLCDLMENIICEIDQSVEFKPFEIQTIKFI